MTNKLSPIIGPEELPIPEQSPHLVLVDARTGSDARENYAKLHLAGALFVDLDTMLANIHPDPANGGRHPLPDPGQFAAVVSALGITPSSHVIAYDDKNASSAAARFWWMLGSLGHTKVQVINGGFDAAIAAGFPTSSGIENVAPTTALTNVEWVLPLADINEVESAAANEKCLVIDVRDQARYNGETEPIDLIAGHIPGAINIPFTSNLDNKGFFRSPEELRDLYLAAIKERKAQDIIVHCGSGVTACHTLLAMDYAGIELPRLYVGSWSEWSRRNKPIGTVKTKL